MIQTTHNAYPQRRRYSLLGREGGKEKIILLFFRPGGVYLSLRTPIIARRLLRFRFWAGSMWVRKLHAELRHQGPA
jgi:hypothetical protein